MSVAQLGGASSYKNGVTNFPRVRTKHTARTRVGLCRGCLSGFNFLSGRVNGTKLQCGGLVHHPRPPMAHRSAISESRNSNLSSDYEVDAYDVTNGCPLECEEIKFRGNHHAELCETSSSSAHILDVKRELVMLSLPAIAGQAIDPLVQLMEMAYIGRLGPLELASAGVSISIFNIISKLFNMPLLSVATSFVAEDISKNSSKDLHLGRKQLPSVSTALLLAFGIGIFEALALYFGSGIFLNLMGVPSVSPMYVTAQRFLSLRALGAPAVIVSLALQGIFRGFKDTKTPVLCLGLGNISAIVLFPVMMYYLRWGVVGAAISTVMSQYIVSVLMLCALNKRAILVPPKLTGLQFGSYLKSGGFLLGRTLAVLTTMALGTSMAARQGPIAMAAHQICLQVWLAVSLLTDALAASGQALIASSLSREDFSACKEIAILVLKIGLLTGVSLAAILGVSFCSLAKFFTTDSEVLRIVKTGVLFVSASQPINSLAFIFDGLHYGVSDFSYAAYSMMTVGVISSAFLGYASIVYGLSGVWSGLTLFMGLRMVAGFLRIASKTGPWWFLYRDMRKTKVILSISSELRYHVAHQLQSYWREW